MELTDIINQSIQKLESSVLPNPLYNQNFFFYPGCVGPIEQRNQLMGYLGAFISFNKLSNEIDICVIPNETFNKLVAEEENPVAKDLREKFLPDTKKEKKPEVPPSSILLLPEKQLFIYIKQYLLKDDNVKKEQFHRINFSYDLI